MTLESHLKFRRLLKLAGCLACGALLLGVPELSAKDQPTGPVDVIKAGAAGAKHTGFKILQDTEANGDYEIWAAPDAVRVRSLAFGYVMASQAPDWKVKVWRADSKTMAEAPLASFMKSEVFFTNKISYAAELRVPKSNRPSKISGDNVHIFEYPEFESVSGAGMFEADRHDEHGLMGGTKLAPRLISIDWPASCKGVGIIYKVMEVSPQAGLPVSVFAEIRDGKVKTGKTIGIINCNIKDRKFAFDDSALKPPPGFKPIKMGKEIFISKSQAEMFDEIYESKTK